MSSQVQTNFTSGTLDPNLKGRSDVKHYYNGAEIMRNVVVSPQGGFSMRDGLEYIDELPPQLVLGSPTVTIPEGGSPLANLTDDNVNTVFAGGNIIGTTDPYVLAVIDFGAPIKSPAVFIRNIVIGGATDEFQVQHSPDNAVWTTFGNLSVVDSTVRDYAFSPRGVSKRYYRLVKIGGTDVPGSSVTIADFMVWLPGDVSNAKLIPFEFDINTRYMMAMTDRAISIYKDGVYQAMLEVPYTHAQIPAVNWTQSLDTLVTVQEDVPPQLIQRQGSDTAWIIADQAFDGIPLFAFSPVASNPAVNITPSVADGAGKMTASAAIWVANDLNEIIEGNGGRARIVEFISTTVVKYVTLFPFFDTDLIASGDWVFNQGFVDAWSSTRGWPRSIAFHEARTVVGGSRDLPSSVWMSRVGLFFDFNLGQFLDDDGIDVVIQADEQAIINNVASGRTVQIFAAQSEYFIPQSADQPITPATVSIRRATRRGSAPNIRTVKLGDEQYFVQRQGRAIREFALDTTERGYTSDNVSLLAASLINSPVSMAARATTDTNQADLALVVNGDGTAAILTTLRDQEVTAWVSWDTPGAAGIFDETGVDLDDIYFCIQRTIGGTDKLFLERQTDTLLADSGLVQTVTGTVVANLDHLEGELVRIVVNGGLAADETVSGGSITLEKSVTDAVVEVGLGYTWEVKDMPVVRELQDGKRVDGKKRVIQQVVELVNTKDLLVNGQRPAFRFFGDNLLDVPITPFTGRKRLEGRLGYDDEAQVTLSGENPLSCTVLMLEKDMIP